MKKQKGITLVALIITVIVLLILAQEKHMSIKIYLIMQQNKRNISTRRWYNNTIDMSDSRNNIQQYIEKYKITLKNHGVDDPYYNNDGVRPIIIIEY